MSNNENGKKPNTQNKKPLSQTLKQKREENKERAQKEKFENTESKKTAINEVDQELAKVPKNKKDWTAETAGESYQVKTNESLQKKGKAKKIILQLLFAVFCIGSVAFTAVSDFSNKSAEGNATFSEIINVLFNNAHFFLMAIIALLGLYVFDTLKTSFMLKTFTKKWKFKLSLETTVITKYYDNITPFASGGQPFAIYNLSKNNVPPGTAATIPIVSIFVMQIVFVLMSVVAFICDTYGAFSDIRLLTDVALVLGVVGLIISSFIPVAVVVFSRNSRLGVTIVNFFIRIGYKLKLVKDPHKTLISVTRGICNYIKCMKGLFSKHKLLLVAEIGLSILVQLSNCSIVFFVLKAFGYDVPEHNLFQEWITVVQWCMILYCMVSFIPTPGNSGASELTFNSLFGTLLLTYTGQGGFCFSAIIIWRILCFYLVILIGFITVSLTKISKHKKMRLQNEQQTLTDNVQEETEQNVEATKTDS